MTEASFFKHETSIVDAGAHVGEGTKIWHFTHVSSGAVIGKHCTLGQNVFISGKSRIGNNVKIQNNVSVYDDVTLEDYVFCGPSMVFTNDFNPRSKYPKHGKFRPTLVKEGATIGANATIVCGTVIGRSAFIGAGSVVTKDVPDYAVVFGSPAAMRGWMCECGEKLLFSQANTICSACSRKFLKKEDKVIETK